MNDRTPTKPFRLRSFVRRDSRITPAQARAHEELWPQFGLSVAQKAWDYEDIFGRKAPCLLEIGFGSGQSLLELAKAHPEQNFIGVETHKPGIGALFLGIKEHALTNLRIYYGDAIDMLEQSVPNASLASVQIFFPDPWPKRRHHLRRLIQPAFVKLIAQKLTAHGSLHLATDWEDYADHMLKVVRQETSFINLAGCHQFGTRSPYRPILTKFEQRALREGRAIFELQLAKRETI